VRKKAKLRVIENEMMIELMIVSKVNFLKGVTFKITKELKKRAIDLNCDRFVRRLKSLNITSE
jgi:hypothetical protein